MKRNLLRRISRVAGATLLATLCAMAQDHQWAGRTLDELERTIHDRLAALPFHGVFDNVRFEVQGKTVTLSGQVLKDSVKQNAERAVARINGVERVVNRIEVLPSSRRDDALRMNLYRAIYEKEPLDKYGTRAAPSIQIIVKNGSVSLEGVVDSDADRSLVFQRASGVAAHVANNLRVSPQQLAEQR
jgi:hyperosmotically inducible periplasmic protein